MNSSSYIPESSRGVFSGHDGDGDDDDDDDCDDDNGVDEDDNDDDEDDDDGDDDDDDIFVVWNGQLSHYIGLYGAGLQTWNNVEMDWQ